MRCQGTTSVVPQGLAPCLARARLHSCRKALLHAVSGHDFSHAARSCFAPCQGTTSVVPQRRQIRPALAAEVLAAALPFAWPVVRKHFPFAPLHRSGGMITPLMLTVRNRFFGNRVFQGLGLTARSFPLCEKGRGFGPGFRFTERCGSSPAKSERPLSRHLLGTSPAVTKQPALSSSRS